ncbi:MAG TPA: carbon monoxide dehydrogenase subunit G, partial [Planosporangium sp.]|nr:carbon monoxide dehydrogenase subunit G [Planosporangium sp.]
MKITGEATLHAPVAKVYAALIDPAVLVRTIPGCHRLERIGADAYRMTVTAGVAAIKGAYAGEVVLADQLPPHAFVLKASGAGSAGTVSAEAHVRLADAGNQTTTLTYDAD